MKRQSPYRDVEFVCLDCSLPICDDKAKGCLYTIKRTAPARRRKARKTIDARAKREAQEIKSGILAVLLKLKAERDKSFAGNSRQISDKAAEFI